MRPIEQRAAEKVIDVKNLTKSYGELTAVDGVSFDVKKGEIFGFLGPNGAGKTTTFSILEGMLGADSGRATILGMDINDQTQAIKRRIGVQLQRTCLIPDLTVFEQLQLFARLYGFQPDSEALIALLAQVGLSPKLTMLPEELSGGQQQRLALAIALVNRPHILFLDEPTTGLDPQSRRMLWDLIRQLRSEGRTIVLTTHYMEEAQALCDRVAIIDRGQIVALASPQDLIQNLSARQSTNGHAAPTEAPNLEDVFLDLTGRAIRAW